jgi:hypothetical protein
MIVIPDNREKEMVDDELRRNVYELRDTAAKLKLLAQRTRSTYARAGLLDSRRAVRAHGAVRGQRVAAPG